MNSLSSVKWGEEARPKNHSRLLDDFNGIDAFAVAARREFGKSGGN
jgi:hypothetical protein